MKIVQAGVLHESVPGTGRAFATFPNIVCLPDGSMLASYRVGSSKDSGDEALELRESRDGGVTWTNARTPFPPFQDNGVRYSCKLAYLTLLRNGTLLAAAMAVDRTSHPGKPLFNDATGGCLPMRILVSKSRDDGASWQEWQPVETPEDIGPPSLTNPVFELADGRLVIGIESNKHYFDLSPWLQKVIYLYSTDDGLTWGSPVVVSCDPSGRIFNWDQRAEVAPAGAIVTFTWVFDSETGAYRNIWRRSSLDGGNSWTEPEDIGFADQGSHPAILEDGRIVLSWVDRFGTQSIRARMAESFRDPFPASTEVILYECPIGKMANKNDLGGTLAEMGGWTYGLPFARALPDGGVIVVFYAGSAAGTSVHWVRLSPA